MIYFIQDEHLGHIKIGFTDGPDAAVRLKQLQTGSPVGLVLLMTIEGDRETEAMAHEKFASARVHGEWFRPVPDLISFMLFMKEIQCMVRRRPSKGVEVNA
jgi:hypothetical protein